MMSQLQVDLYREYPEYIRRTSDLKYTSRGEMRKAMIDQVTLPRPTNTSLPPSQPGRT